MIKVLGSYGNRLNDHFSTSFLIKENIVIDAGNLTNGLGKSVLNINHVFLTHSHFDHIVDLPFVIDVDFEKRENTLNIYGLTDTINSVKELFNDKLWPDFTKIRLLNNKPAIRFIEIQENEKFIFDDLEIQPIYANHTVPTVGYKLIKNNITVIISGDTYLNDKLIQEVNNSKNLKLLMLEVSFPNRLEKLAKSSKHLTPNLINKLKQKIDNNIKIAFYHFKAEYKSEIIEELNELNLISSSKQILEDGVCLHVFKKDNCSSINENKYKQELKKLIKIGVDLSQQSNIDYLLEDILSVAREFTNADAGSVYLKNDDKLCFKIIQNDTLNTYMGGRNSKISWPSLELYIDGKENKCMVAALSALTQKIFNISDVYKNEEFDFNGTKEFDNTTGYYSKNMLVIPLIDHQKETIGVLQLINKKDGEYFIPFTQEDEDITMTLASQAAVSITKNKLIHDLEGFIESFINMIAKAIDEKSEYTGKHVQKVSILAEILSTAINEDDSYFKDIHYDENMLKQIKIAALLHDIGKITTDPKIMDKATKLEKVYNRLNVVMERFEIIKRDLMLKGIYDFKELEDDLNFLKVSNKGSEFMSDDKVARIDEIANKYKYVLEGKEVAVLRDDEVDMLKIKKGTLSPAERKHIERHAFMTWDMLSHLPFPKEYDKVTHIASNHHEKLNCKGYYRGLCEKDLCLEDRLLAICDIFEALTARDRPYKSPKKLSEVFKIMDYMVKDGEIDGKLYKFFIDKKIWKKYTKYLLPEQIDI